MSFRNPIRSLSADQITPGTLSGSVVQTGDTPPRLVLDPTPPADAATNGDPALLIYGGYDGLPASPGSLSAAITGGSSGSNVHGGVALRAPSAISGNLKPTLELTSEPVNAITGVPSGEGQSLNLVLTGGNASNGEVDVYAYSGTDGASKSAYVQLVAKDASTASPRTTAQLTVGSGLVSVTAPVVKDSQTWQTPAYNTNWQAATTFAGNTGYRSLQYRIDAQDNLHIIGCFSAGAVAPTNPVFTLPAAYRPKAAMPLFCQRNNAGVVTTGHVYVGSSGNLNVTTASGLGIAAGNEYVVSGVIPLNNIA